MKEFATTEIRVHFSKFESDKVHNEAAVSQYRAEMQRRQDDFMRQRIGERKRQ